MGAAPKKKESNVTPLKTNKPTLDPVIREQQLTALAVDLAEKQLREGTASTAVITHYLKIASTREAIEREILERQAELISAKSSAIISDKNAEDVAKKAIDAMRDYSPS